VTRRAPESDHTPAPRVLHVVESWRPLPSGYASRSWWIVTGQRRLGISRPSVLVTSRQSTYGDAPPAPAAGIVLTALAPSATERRRRPNRPFFVDRVHLREAIVRTARVADARLIHVHWSSAIGCAAADAAQELGIALVAEVRFDLAGAMNAQLFRGRMAPAEAGLRRWFERHLKRADAVTAASEVLAGLLRRQGLRVTAVPNGVDADFLSACDAAAARRTAAPGGRVMLGTTSKMLRYEHLDAFFAVLRAVPETDATFVGDGPESSRLKALAQAFAPGRVTFTGRVPAEKIPDRLAAMDLFLVPRENETITRFAGPIKVVEAMAAGRCVVGSAVGETVSLLAGGRGVLVPPGNVAPLVHAVQTLAADPDRRGRLGAAARAYARDTLAGDALLQRYAGVYARAMRGRPVNPPHERNR